jgi:predicted small secreted protein
VETLKHIRTITVVILAAVVLAACATQPVIQGTGLPGLLHGMLHGVLMPFSFIGSFFLDVRIYAFPNNGWPYDLGFMAGATFLGATVFLTV